MFTMLGSANICSPAVVGVTTTYTLDFGMGCSCLTWWHSGASESFSQPCERCDAQTGVRCICIAHRCIALLEAGGTFANFNGVETTLL